MLGGSLCSEYLALQPEEEEDCETVMEEKCVSQDRSLCTTQYVKVITQLIARAEVSSVCLGNLVCFGKVGKCKSLWGRFLSHLKILSAL